MLPTLTWKKAKQLFRIINTKNNYNKRNTTKISFRSKINYGEIDMKKEWQKNVLATSTGKGKETNKLHTKIPKSSSTKNKKNKKKLGTI